MSIRRFVRQSLARVSPDLSERCTAAWECLDLVAHGRMSARGAAMYFVRGLCPGLAGKFSYRGVRVYFPTGSVLFRLTCEHGDWEPDVTNLLCRLAKPNHLFIDVGANIGLTSIPVLRNVLDSRVLSFEPSPNTKDFLQRTRDESPFRDAWEVVAKAAGESPGTVDFYVAAARHGGWDGLKDTGQAGHVRRVTIPQTTIDSEWQRLGCPPVSCMKIDVEGAENKVLSGAQELIKRQHPYLVLEWSRPNLAANGVEPDFLLKYADSRGYDVLCVPDLRTVSESSQLEMAMTSSEMFVLVPRSQAAGAARVSVTAARATK